MFNIASAYFMMWWYAQNVNLVSKNVQLRQCKGGKICSPIFSFVALNFTQGIKGLQKDLRAGIRTTRNQGFWECESWSMAKQRKWQHCIGCSYILYLANSTGIWYGNCTGMIQAGELMGRISWNFYEVRKNMYFVQGWVFPGPYA